MAYAVVAFGPNDSFFFGSQSGWVHNNLPYGIIQLLNTPPSVREVMKMALGPNGSYFIVYMDQAGFRKITWHLLPPALEAWFVPQPGQGCVRDLETLKCSLGPDGSYFAFDKSNTTCAGLPAGLLAQYAARTNVSGWNPGEFPKQVSLGPAGSYIMTMTNGGACWDLCGYSMTLDRYLRGTTGLNHVHIAISAYQYNVFAACLQDGQTFVSIPGTYSPSFQSFEIGYKAAVQRAQVAQLVALHQAPPSYDYSQMVAINKAPIYTTSPVRSAGPAYMAAGSRLSTQPTAGAVTLESMKLLNTVLHTMNHTGAHGAHHPYAGGAVYGGGPAYVQAAPLYDTSTIDPTAAAAPDPAPAADFDFGSAFTADAGSADMWSTMDSGTCDFGY